MNANQDLINKVVASLDKNAEKIDSYTLSKIRKARYRVLEQLDEKRIDTSWWVSTSVAVLACMVFFVFVLTPKPYDEPGSFIEDLELITTVDELELYEELEFYEWLEEYDLPT